MAEDFFWAQWDTEAQRLFYIVEKVKNDKIPAFMFDSLKIKEHWNKQSCGILKIN